WIVPLSSCNRNERAIIRQPERHRLAASHARGVRLRTRARDRAGHRPRRRHHAHPAHFPVDRGDHLSLHAKSRMGRLRAFVRKIYRPDLARRRADGRDPGISLAGASPFRDLRARRSRHQTAKDLEGRAVGIPEWAQTAGIYVRGFLAEEYGVDLGKIRWLQAGVDEPGRTEKVALKLPGSIRYEARPDTSLSAMLLSGEVDAVITARMPDAFARDDRVVRLFPNYRAEEERFFRKTGIFPIMHLVTIRRTVFEPHPWIAMNLFKMFDEAKRRCFTRLRDFTCARL